MTGEIKSGISKVAVRLPEKIGIRPIELELSFFAVIVLSGVYVAYEILAEPAGSHPFGHGLGVLGAVLMLATELLYSIRKRTSWLNRAGPVRYWLSGHIFTGIVGPFLVLMHTGLAFRGFAGLSFALTAIVVGSGFIGRYLYTALPRTLGGGEVTPAELSRRRLNVEHQLKEIASSQPFPTGRLIETWLAGEEVPQGWRSVIGRKWWERRYRREVYRSLQKHGVPDPRPVETLMVFRWRLARQLIAVETVRAWLRMWHLFHVPLGLTLFFSIAIHIVATLYYGAGQLWLVH